MSSVPLFVHSPVSESVKQALPFIKETDVFRFHTLPISAELFPLMIDVRPCVAIFSIPRPEDVRPVCRLLDGFRRYRTSLGYPQRDPTLRIILVAEERSVAVERWHELGVHEFIIAPILPRALQFKISRHQQRSIVSHIPECAVAKKEEEVIVIQAKPVLPEPEATPPVEEPSQNVDLLAVDPDWAKRFMFPEFTMERSDLPPPTLEVVASIPELQDGQWVATPNGDESWDWTWNPPPSEKKKGGWKFEGDQPVYDKKHGSWKFAGKKPDLTFRDEKGQETKWVSVEDTPRGREVVINERLDVQEVSVRGTGKLAELWTQEKSRNPESDAQSAIPPEDVNTNNPWNWTSGTTSGDRSSRGLPTTPEDSNEEPSVKSRGTGNPEGENNPDGEEEQEDLPNFYVAKGISVGKRGNLRLKTEGEDPLQPIGKLKDESGASEARKKSTALQSDPSEPEKPHAWNAPESPAAPSSGEKKLQVTKLREEIHSETHNSTRDAIHDTIQKSQSPSSKKVDPPSTGTNALFDRLQAALLGKPETDQGSLASSDPAETSDKKLLSQESAKDEQTAKSVADALGSLSSNESLNAPKTTESGPNAGSLKELNLDPSKPKEAQEITSRLKTEEEQSKLLQMTNTETGANAPYRTSMEDSEDQNTWSMQNFDENEGLGKGKTKSQKQQDQQEQQGSQNPGPETEQSPWHSFDLDASDLGQESTTTPMDPPMDPKEKARLLEQIYKSLDLKKDSIKEEEKNFFARWMKKVLSALKLNDRE